MKKLFVLLILFIPVSVNAQDFKTIQDGIEYAEMSRTIENLPVRMNLLRLDLTKIRLDVVHAMDSAIGTETVSSMAKRHNAFAAINAGFFRLDKSIFAGDSAGILQIDRKLWSESHNNRIALGIINGKNKTEVNFGHIKSDSHFVRGTDETFPIAGINRERKENEVVLYTPEFNRTSLTDFRGFELIIKGKFVERIMLNKGSSEIPSDGFILSVNNKQYERLSAERNIIRLKIKLSALGAENQYFFNQAEDITNGVPQLIKNSKIEITWKEENTTESFVKTKHPRTAVAKLKNGKFLMITVDGRSEESVGINLEDLAKILLEMGATDAMNLDGGGSTTMFLEGKIVNKPSDKEGERKVSDAILVFPRRK